MGRLFLEISGQRFGHLVAIARAEKYRWICACDCGRQCSIMQRSLASGHTKSCGCMTKEMQRAARYRHGHTARDVHKYCPSRTYVSWQAMLRRCMNHRNKRYPSYGGRGIKVCEDWLLFENFLRDMGERPLGRSIDRINNDGNYEPNNCRWATPKEQANNRRKQSHITKGVGMSFSSWLHNFFHNVNPHKVAGALAASKTTIDSLGAIEKWAWLPQFDDAMTKAIAELNNWQTGDPKIEVVEALQAVQTVLGSVKGLSQKDEAVIAICTGAVESGIALFG